jgi:hypothetical protein
MLNVNLEESTHILIDIPSGHLPGETKGKQENYWNGLSYEFGFWVQ